MEEVSSLRLSTTGSKNMKALEDFFLECFLRLCVRACVRACVLECVRVCVCV